ncbi:hypothetical protein V5799_026439 [Amblyomma americanum]|uniref:BMERB domain-containing protein n=1 Tax=Amblyomma americanum TaxID=6943 RepID=A0AAQ4DIK1_AMBAM
MSRLVGCALGVVFVKRFSVCRTGDCTPLHAAGPPERPVRRRRASAEPPPSAIVAVIDHGIPPRSPPLLHQQSRPSSSSSDPFRFREMDLLTEMGVAYARQVRNVRRAALADTSALRQFSTPGRKAVEEVEEGLFQVQRMHSHLVARANHLVYRLQDVLLQEESNRLRKQMHWITSLPPEKQTSQVRDREHDLIVRIVRIVNKRDAILAEHNVEQRRAASELRQMEKEYQRWRREWARPPSAVTVTSAKKSASKTTFSPFRTFKRRVAKTVGKVASKKKGKRPAPAMSTSTELCAAKL